jgi:hypothetical protein
VRVFRQKFTLEDAIGSHACSLEASWRVTNGIPLGCSLFLPVHTINCVQTLKAPEDYAKAKVQLSRDEMTVALGKMERVCNGEADVYIEVVKKELQHFEARFGADRSFMVNKFPALYTEGSVTFIEANKSPQIRFADYCHISTVYIGEKVNVGAHPAFVEWCDSTEKYLYVKVILDFFDQAVNPSNYASDGTAHPTDMHALHQSVTKGVAAKGAANTQPLTVKGNAAAAKGSSSKGGKGARGAKSKRKKGGKKGASKGGQGGAIPGGGVAMPGKPRTKPGLNGVEKAAALAESMGIPNDGSLKLRPHTINPVTGKLQFRENAALTSALEAAAAAFSKFASVTKVAIANATVVGADDSDAARTEGAGRLAAARGRAHSLGDAIGQYAVDEDEIAVGVLTAERRDENGLLSSTPRTVVELISPTSVDAGEADDDGARCAFSDKHLHSKMPLDPMHVRFKRTCV